MPEKESKNHKLKITPARGRPMLYWLGKKLLEASINELQQIEDIGPVTTAMDSIW